MSPPAPIQCHVTGCQYTTRDNINSMELQIRDLELHVKMVHELNRGANQIIAQPQHGGAAKPDKLPRPAVSEGIAEADWVWWKQEQWKRYKRSTGLEGQNILDQLWACAGSSLARRCYEAGNTDNITEENLLARMKKLAIRAQNKLVNIVEFLNIAQAIGK